MTDLSTNPARMNRLDHRRAWLIAGVYLIVAFVWLGSFKSPQTGWVPQKKGDSFVVDFGRPVTIDRTLLFGGLGPVWGCFGSLKMDAWQNGAYEPFTVVDMEALFRWHNSTDTVTTDRLRITTQAQLPKKDGTAPNYWQAEYRELAFFSGKERITGFTVSEVPGAPGISALFDEQELVPYRPNVLHSTYFDEVYFPRTALEQLLDWPVIYENTHPPLGKDIMQVGIAIMGMTPFGWRWLGTLTGALMLPLMYAMAKRLFKDSYWATFCTLFLAADFMHFVQTRIGTVDSYLVLFIMAAYHFMLVYLDEPAWKKGFWRSLAPLALSGLFLGLAGAVKWIGFFAAFGLAFLFFVSRVTEGIAHGRHVAEQRLPLQDARREKRRWFLRYVLLTCLACVALFIVVPAIVYTLSYVPVPKNDDTKTFLKWVIDSQPHMFNYHKGVTAPHPYYAFWYEWPLNLRPIFFYDAALLQPPWDEAIASFGNPLVWWSGLVGIFVVLGLLARSAFRLKSPASVTVRGNQTAAGNPWLRNRLLWFPLAGWLAQYVPWIVSPRKMTFAYHYFSCTPFLILAAGILFQTLEHKGLIKRRGLNIVLCVAIALFVVYYPVLSGIPVPRAWLTGLQILPRWEW